MASRSNPLRYGSKSVQRFETYFTPPKKKRGRPKKKKRGAKKKTAKRLRTSEKQIMLGQTDDNTVDLTNAKELDDLDARLEGVVAKDRRSTGSRINWDKEPNASLRIRIADSWTKKNDLHEEGESFNRFCNRMGIHRNVLTRFLEGKYFCILYIIMNDGDYLNMTICFAGKYKGAKAKSRGRPSLLSESVMRHMCESMCESICICLITVSHSQFVVSSMIFNNCFSFTICCLTTVIKFHDDQSEGLTRQTIASMIRVASGNTLSRQQSLRTWDKTIHPFGRENGLLTGYVKPQTGTSKRTAAGKESLQRDWHVLVDELHSKVRRRAQEVLQDEDLVEKMMPSLVGNCDEENLQAMGKNTRVAGSSSKKKHDDQNGSFRQVQVFHNDKCQRIFFFYENGHKNKPNS